MSKRRLAFALLALLALAALLAGSWLATRGGGAEATRGGGALKPSAAAPPAGAQAAELAPLAEVRPAAAETAEARPARALASTAYEEELARGLWVEGRVVLPEGTPPGERAKVVAKGKELKHGPLHTADVGPDGRFRVAFAEGTNTGRLDLEARYVFLHEPLKVSPGKPEPIVLEARLGGVLSGRVLPPPEVEEGAQKLLGRRVQLRGWKRTGESALSSAVVRSVELDASLAFEFTSLPADLEYDVECDPLVYEAAGIDDFFVQAGEETVLELPVLLGVRVAGRVVDEAGAGVLGALVNAGPTFRRGSWRQSKTAADGAFVLEGLTPGAVTLHATAKGHEPLEHALGRFERGAEMDGVELKLLRGSSVTGRVRWPDGSPAEGATVTAEDRFGRGFGQGVTTKTDAEGAFALAGLGDGPHRIQARATRKSTVTVTSELTGKPREKTVRTTLRATLVDVETGAAGLVLELSDGLGVSGVVVDDLGTPLQDFRVVYGRVVRTDTYSYTRNDQGRAFKDAAGAFELAGLEPGTYELRVEAEGHVSSPQIEVTVPSEQPLATVRLPRSGRLAGQVLTPSGAPAAKALIETTNTPERGMQFTLSLHMATPERFSPAGEADGQGLFAVEGAPNASLKVRALLSGYAPSEPLELALEPGGSLAGLVLRLQDGATLSGVVLDAGGQGAPRRLVQVDREPGSFDASVQTDEAGRFELTGLEPGTYSVVAPPSEAELAAFGVSAESAHEVLARKAEVELGAQGAHVVLSYPALRPVRVFGRLTAGGEPAQARLWINPEGGGESVSVESDAHGEYEVLLAAPGNYTFMLSLDDHAVTVNVPATVKGPAEERLDFDVPVGSISGRVFGPDGALGGLAVELQRAQGDGSQGWGHARAETDADGRYALERLPAGTWTVQAGGGTGRHGGGPPAQGATYTRAAQSGIVVASGERVRDVDLHLSAGGILAGRVLTAAGEPASRAHLCVRTPAGLPVELYTFASTDGAGNFSLGGVGPGDYVLGAQLGADQGGEAPVTIEAGRETRVELRLAAGTLVRVRVRDAAGAPAEAHVTCAGAGGRDYSSWIDWSQQSQAPPGERRVGPLPPGTYTFKADREGATPDTQTVTLKGEPELMIELVL